MSENNDSGCISKNLTFNELTREFEIDIWVRTQEDGEPRENCITITRKDLFCVLGIDQENFDKIHGS